MTIIQPRVMSSATMISKKPRKDKIANSFLYFIIEIGGLGKKLEDSVWATCLFFIHCLVTTDPKFEMGKMFGFSHIIHGLLVEPHFVYAPLFDHEWCHPINMHDGEYICLGNPSSPNSVALSSSIEIIMEIYVTTEKKACFELCRKKFNLNLLNIWVKNLGNECGYIKVEGEDGFREMYYTCQ